jgi:multiple sugar transport system substrate-binding protein
MVGVIKRGRGAVVGLTGVAMLAAACGTTTPAKPAGVSPSAKQTIEFAESGLGTEGQATQAEVNAFEKLHPNITVKIDVLSSDSTTYLQQLEQRFAAGSPTPDVFESDVTYPAAFAKAGWVLRLDSYKPDLSSFFSGEVAAGQYQGGTYAIPWFDNPEGLFYRTDLVPTPPATPTQLVSDAQAAMRADPSLKEGLAFEGAKYEGAITAYLTTEGAFGGKLDPSNLDTAGNVAALSFLYDALYTNHIAPTAVTGWEEGQVQQEFSSGHAAFAINYPFVFSATTRGDPAYGHIGYIPFPPAPGGSPSSALGGEMLAINAKSSHAAAAWELIQYLTSVGVMVSRAEASGDPPAKAAAYTNALYAKDPQFRAIKALAADAAPRPVSPVYPQISSDLQSTLSAVFANQIKPAQALSQAGPAIKALAAKAGA